MMVQSANDASVALAIHIAGSKDGFVDLMNRKAQELGMKNTRFHSVHGLPPSEGQQPDVSTARDFAILCRELAKRPEALKFTGVQTRGFREDKFIMHNHNKLLGRVSGCDGFKTGYYEAAGFSIAATARKGGVRIIALVMGSKDRKIRDAKAAELLAEGFRLVPPQPEATETQKPEIPKPPASKAAAGPQSVEQQKPETAPSSGEGGSGWNKFLLGLAAGFLLCLGFFVIARILRKNSITASFKYMD